MTVSAFDALIGQESVVAELRAVAERADAALLGGARTGMSHAWLFTGPPGSGRSNVARAFAAALQCADAGCGDCDSCHTVAKGTHADVLVVRPSLVSFGVAETRDLVRRAALAPAGRRWQVVVVEDADRLTDHAVNALLKTIEEPAPHTVWLLCAPTPEDMLATVRSRCRHVRLRTPPAADIAEVLRREGVDGELATVAAQASQGHIGRARWLATDEAARTRRDEVLRTPVELGSLDACLDAAARLAAAADADARAATERVDASETEEMRRALGFGTEGRSPRQTDGVLRDLDARQRKRAKRQQRDALDRALLDLTAFYRDVLARQLGAAVPLVNMDVADRIATVARADTPEATLRRIQAIVACREALDANAATALALESMVFALRAG